MSVPRPKLTVTGGIYLLDFIDEKITVQVDRISENSRYETSGEITLTSRIPGSVGHVHRARLNLTSSPTRKSMGKVLDEKISGIGWDDILEYVCVMVLDKYREGTPTIRLADHAMPERLVFRLRPYLQERQATLLFGEGDTGKSYLAIWMSVLVSAGVSLMGMEAEPGNVLYLDYETDEDTLWERVNLISAGLGIAIPDGFLYRRMHQLLAADFQQINRLVVDNNISLVVVDSAAPAVGEPESSAPTNEYFAALRSLRTCSLTVAHVAKGGKENEPFGSIFWRNLPRANFRVNASHEPGSNEFVIGLKHTKSNNGKRLRDQAFQIDFAGDAVTFSKANISDIPDLSETLSHSQRISATLHKGGKTVKELAEKLDMAEGTIRTTLHRQKNKLFIPVETNGGDIKWGNLIHDHV